MLRRGTRLLRRGTRLVISLAIGVAACDAALAQTVGRTTSIKPGVFRNSAGTLIGLGVGAPVIADDLLNTDVQGRTNLRFLDQSTLDIGPGSDVKIDRFVYNPNRTTAGASISLAKGVLRYNSRGAPDGAVQIRTPTSTLGIRGTTIATAYNPITRETWHQIGEGVAEVCPTNVPASSTAPPPRRPIISKDGPSSPLLTARPGCATITPQGNNTAFVDAAGNIRVFNSPIAADMTLGLGQQAGVIGAAGTSLIAGIQPVIGLGLAPAAIIGGGILGAIVITGVVVGNDNDDNRRPPLSP
jgi:hypothetical protein